MKDEQRPSGCTGHPDRESDSRAPLLKRKVEMSITQKERAKWRGKYDLSDPQRNFEWIVINRLLNALEQMERERNALITLRSTSSCDEYCPCAETCKAGNASECAEVVQEWAAQEAERGKGENR